MAQYDAIKTGDVQLVGDRPESVNQYVWSCTGGAIEALCTYTYEGQLLTQIRPDLAVERHTKMRLLAMLAMPVG